MTRDEFNEKYKAFIEPGFEDQGLEFDIPDVTEYLDKIFEDLIKIPGFYYSQIKVKFGTCRFYTEGISWQLAALIENYINKILKVVS